ncbi:MAG: helix-turn-helix transcriptional regulator [Bacteroidales bacterium]|nr:helix-turn-helix transcriptional regulator [Bacteroidales bacterium]
MPGNGTFGVNLSGRSFYIRRMNTQGVGKALRMPSATLPLVGFLYLDDGEVVVEASSQTYLCSAGHLLLIPEGMPFRVAHYSGAVGYSGCFPASIISDSKGTPPLKKPLQQAFWFDEGLFMKELFNMLELSFERSDMTFIEKGLALLVSRIKPGPENRLPERVSGFMDELFDESCPLLNASEYATSAGLSANYLNRLVKDSTGKPVRDWIEIARLSRAKKLLGSTSMDIIDVAAAVGIDDQSYFSRFFKKQTGMTPTAFRNLMHEKS